MRIDVSSGEIRLTENRPVSLRDGRGLRIECTAGVVWITLTGQVADIFLTPGQSHRLQGDGLALIEGIGGGSIRLDRPARRPGFMRRLSCLCEALWPGPHSVMSPS